MRTNREKKKSILWISPFAPYDRVAHAGGQDFNHLLKYLHNLQLFDLHIVSLCLKSEKNNLDLDYYHITNTIYVINSSKLLYHTGLILDRLSYYNPFHFCGNLLTPYTRLCFIMALNEYFSAHSAPDIIILHWTQAALMYSYISKLCPHSRIVIIEVDVAYLGYQRQLFNTENFFSKWLWKMKHYHLKKAELECVRNSSLTVVLNEKDGQILKNDGIDSQKIFVSIPYFHNYINCSHEASNCNILFFGYMGRKENHLSALWFIRQVMPLLKDDFHFTVIGIEPQKELLQLQDDRIHVLGFVDDPVPYFQSCLCLVAPLVLGAGIKIKVLEALSSGIPVLTNSIGIEGIPAKDGRDFFYCETPEQYAEKIKALKNRSIKTDICQNAKKFIQTNFNTDARLNELAHKLQSL